MKENTMLDEIDLKIIFSWLREDYFSSDRARQILYRTKVEKYYCIDSLKQEKVALLILRWNRDNTIQEHLLGYMFGILPGVVIYEDICCKNDSGLIIRKNGTLWQAERFYVQRFSRPWQDGTWDAPSLEPNQYRPLALPCPYHFRVPENVFFGITRERWNFLSSWLAKWLPRSAQKCLPLLR